MRRPPRPSRVESGRVKRQLAPTRDGEVGHAAEVAVDAGGLVGSRLPSIDSWPAWRACARARRRSRSMPSGLSPAPRTRLHEALDHRLAGGDHDHAQARAPSRPVVLADDLVVEHRLVERHRDRLGRLEANRGGAAPPRPRSAAARAGARRSAGWTRRGGRGVGSAFCLKKLLRLWLRPSTSVTSPSRDHAVGQLGAGGARDAAAAGLNGRQEAHRRGRDRRFRGEFFRRG